MGEKASATFFTVQNCGGVEEDQHVDAEATCLSWPFLSDRPRLNERDHTARAEGTESEGRLRMAVPGRICTRNRTPDRCDTSTHRSY
jgi:hypothetical protein